MLFPPPTLLCRRAFFLFFSAQCPRSDRVVSVFSPFHLVPQSPVFASCNLFFSGAVRGCFFSTAVFSITTLFSSPLPAKKTRASHTHLFFFLWRVSYFFSPNTQSFPFVKLVPAFDPICVFLHHCFCFFSPLLPLSWTRCSWHHTVPLPRDSSPALGPVFAFASPEKQGSSRGFLCPLEQTPQAQTFPSPNF